jgi:hypothetical protein
MCFQESEKSGKGICQAWQTKTLIGSKGTPLSQTILGLNPRGSFDSQCLDRLVVFKPVNIA